MIEKQNLDYIYHKLAIIFIGLGMMTMSQSYLSGYQGVFDYTLFWIGILIAVLPVLIITMNMENKAKTSVLLFSIGLLFYLPIIFWSPNYFRFTDEILHFNSVETILDQGNLNINPVFTLSKYYPGIEFLTIYFHKFGGLPIFNAAKILMAVVHSMTLVFIYFIFRIVTSQKIAVLGSIIYAVNPEYMFFDSLFSYETLGIFLMIASIFIIFKHDVSNLSKIQKLSYSLISIIMVSALIITHPFSSYMFSIFLILASISYYRYCPDVEKRKYMLRFTILVIILIELWVLCNAQSTIKYFYNMIFGSISSVLNFLGEGTIQRRPFWLTVLPRYEIIIDTYLYIPLLFIIYLFTLKLIKRNKKANLMPLIIYGGLFFASVPLIFTNAGKLFMFRSWAFTFIGLSISIAIALQNILERDIKFKISIFFSIILLIIGGISTGSSSSYRDPNYLDASVPSSVTLDVVKASDWFESYFGHSNLLLGDSTIYTVFRGYGGQYVDTNPFIFYKNNMDADSIYYIYKNSFRFIVIDNRITEKLPVTRYYFDETELDMKDNWGYINPFPKQNLAKFDKYGGFYRIFDNGNIKIYYIDPLFGATA